MKKVHGLFLLLTILVGASIGFAEQPKHKFPEKIRFGFQPGSVLFELAAVQGWFDEEFKKDGISLEYVKFLSGPPLIEAFAGNRLDIGLIGDQPLIQARANNIDIKAIAAQSKDSRSSGLLVPIGSPIKTLKDLKGKKVGTKIGSASHNLLVRYLESAGLTLKDIQLVNLDPPNIKVALASKDIDAAVLWEPWVTIIEDEKVGKVLFTSEGYKKSTSIIIASSRFTNEYPEVTVRLLRIFQRSVKFIDKNPQKAAELISDYDGIKARVLLKIIKKRDYDLRLDDYAISALTETTRFLREYNFIRKDINPRELVDTKFLKEAGIQ
jgi:sulfonate transport system substrate-binding protein